MTTRRDDRRVPDMEPEDERVVDPAGRPTPYVTGPTGPSPISSELRGAPELDEDDDRGEGEDARR